MALKSDAKKSIVKDMAGDEKNTGSAHVQIALLTEKIKLVNEHMKINIHDFSAQRGLLKNIGQRRKFLKYLRAKDQGKYEEVLAKLGLRK